MIKSVIMLGIYIKTKRKEQHLSIKELSQKIGIDSSLLSRIETESRAATEDQVRNIALALQLEANPFITRWLGDKVLQIVKPYPEVMPELMQVMESRVEYLTGVNAHEQFALSEALTSKLEAIAVLHKSWIMNRPSAGTQLEKLNEHAALEYTFESNRIEGNTLSLQETFLVISEGLTIAGKSVREHLEAINHDEAIDFIKDMVYNKLPITEYRLKQLHYLVLKGIDRKNAGVYRSVPVRIGGSAHLPPQPFEIGKMMEDLFKFYEEQANKMHPVLLAAEMHERLVTIHPFIDGNGRTSRLLMNLILLQHGYTIAILKGNNADKLRYYKALESVQVDANPEPFYNLIAEVVEKSLQNHLALI